MAYTFALARGLRGGRQSGRDPTSSTSARRLCSKRGGDKIILPVDDHCADRIATPTASNRQITEGDIPDGFLGLDIGPKTQRPLRRTHHRNAKTVIWNGPMGVFEVPPFDAGTRAVAEAVAAFQPPPVSSAAATPPPLSSRWAWPTASATCRPVAAPASKCSRARVSLASSCWTRAEDPRRSLSRYSDHPLGIGSEVTVQLRKSETTFALE